MGKLRLFAPANVVALAEEVMRQIAENYDLPNVDFRNSADRPAQNCVDILRAFGEACREDLQRCAPAAAAAQGASRDEVQRRGIPVRTHHAADAAARWRSARPHPGPDLPC
jgi:hypothetical protein